MSRVEITCRPCNGKLQHEVLWVNNTECYEMSWSRGGTLRTRERDSDRMFGTKGKERKRKGQPRERHKTIDGAAL